jgi:hypothetical protein
MAHKADHQIVDDVVQTRVHRQTQEHLQEQIQRVVSGLHRLHHDSNAQAPLVLPLFQGSAQLYLQRARLLVNLSPHPVMPQISGNDVLQALLNRIHGKTSSQSSSRDQTGDNNSLNDRRTSGQV